MNLTTRTAVEAILSADRSVTAEQRAAGLTALLTVPPHTAERMPRIIRRAEASRLLGVGLKRVDQLSRSGVLQRVTVPGTSRAIGLSEASVRAITEGRVSH